MQPNASSLAEMVDDLHVIATMLNQTIPANFAWDLTELRPTIASLTDAADDAAISAAEHGDSRAIHHAFACAKELAVLTVQLDSTPRRANRA